MSLNLTKGARPDEVFYLQTGKPEPKINFFFRWRWLLRVTSWKNIYKQDGSPARFVNVDFFWGGQFYFGTAKCDGSRTYGYWGAQYGEPVDSMKYVMTATPKEMLAFRWRMKGSDKEPIWNNMGAA